MSNDLTGPDRTRPDPVRTSPSINATVVTASK